MRASRSSFATVLPMSRHYSTTNGAISSRRRVLSGIQPSGDLHLGNATMVPSGIVQSRQLDE